MPIVPATPVSRTRQQILGAPARIGTIDDGSRLSSAIVGLGDTVGSEITAHMQRLKTEADENEAILAQSQYLDAMTAAHYDGESAFLNRKGNNARGAFPDSRNFGTKQMEDIAKSLSPDASKIFKRAANQIRANFGTQTIKHVGAQTEQARVEALSAGQASLQDAYVKARDPEEREDIAKALDAVLDQQTVGSTPESVQVTKDFSDGNITGTAAVNALNRGDLEDAKTILASERGKHMEESTRIRVQKGIDESEHLTAVQGTTQEALVRFPDPSQASQAEAWIKRNSSGAVQSNSLTNIRKRRSADATAETAQRKAENESAHSFADNILSSERRGEPPMGTAEKIAMGQQLVSRIQDHTKRASFQRRWDDEVVEGFAAVTNRAHYSKLNIMSHAELVKEDLRTYTLERQHYEQLLLKQNNPESLSNADTKRISLALRDIAIPADSPEGVEFSANFYSDRGVFEAATKGKMSTQDQDKLLLELKKGAQRITDVPFFFHGFSDPGLSVSDIQEQFNNMPTSEIERFTKDLKQVLHRDPEPWEVVSAIRLDNTKRALGVGRISEPEIVAPAETAPAAPEAQERTRSSIIDTSLLQSSLRGFP